VLSLAAAIGLRVPAAVPWTLAPFLGEYAAFLLRAKDDPFAPAVAAGLVAVAELAYWALEPRPVGSASWVAVRRVATLALLCGIAAAVAAFVVGAARLDPRGGLALEAVGAAAVVCAIGVVAVLARAGATR
jgi:hypothetical protein